MDAKTDESAGKCPVAHTTVAPKTNRDWWPNQLNIQVLHQNSNLSNPMGAAFDYAKECDEPRSLRPRLISAVFFEGFRKRSPRPSIE
jgi:catalase (peroxidase I)